MADAPDEMQDRLAKVLFNHAVEQGRAEVASRIFPVSKIEEVVTSTATASDREAAIVLFCLADDILTDFFRERLTGNVPNGVDEAFFSGNGILATANNKLTLLAGLQWIRKVTHRDLSFMRKIRNEFAHHVLIQTFDQSPVRDFVDQMRPSEEGMLSVIAETQGRTYDGSLTRRTKFLLRANIAVGALVQDLAVMQASEHHRVPAGAILGVEFDVLPENVKAVVRANARAAYAILGAELPAP